MKKYIAYYNGEVYYFDTWNECKTFTDDKLFVKYKKINSQEEADIFIEEAKKGKKKKVYIVIYKNEAKVYDNWGACKNFVESYPDCKYKSFSSEEDAQEYINKNIKKELSLELKDILYCYVGGTYKGRQSGFVLVKNDEIISQSTLTDNGTDKNDGYKLWDELQSTIKGVKEATKLNEDRVIVVHTGEGVESWANGTWKTKKKFTKEYSEDIKKLSKEINIDFLRVI